MTKEQIHRLIKKIRTRRDYYQMQKSLQMVADVLENLVDEDRKGEKGEKGEKGDKGDSGTSSDTLQTILDRGRTYIKTENNRISEYNLSRPFEIIETLINGQGTKERSSITVNWDTIKLSSYSNIFGYREMYMILGASGINFLSSKHGYGLNIFPDKSSPVVLKLPDATGDDTFSKIVVSKPDGTLGVINISDFIAKIKS